MKRVKERIFKDTLSLTSFVYSVICPTSSPLIQLWIGWSFSYLYLVACILSWHAQFQIELRSPKDVAEKETLSQRGKGGPRFVWRENEQAWDSVGRGFVYPVLKEWHGEVADSIKTEQNTASRLGLLKTASYKQRACFRLRGGEWSAKPSRDLQSCFDLKNNTLYQCEWPSFWIYTAALSTNHMRNTFMEIFMISFKVLLTFTSSSEKALFFPEDSLALFDSLVRQSRCAVGRESLGFFQFSPFQLQGNWESHEGEQWNREGRLEFQKIKYMTLPFQCLSCVIPVCYDRLGVRNHRVQRWKTLNGHRANTWLYRWIKT